MDTSIAASSPIQARKPPEQVIKPSYVYFLESTTGKTYIGATIDLERRLRQHNGELSGGAIQTTTRVLCGETWERICYVDGFPSWTGALQFEWRWKSLSRGERGRTPRQRRFKALKRLFDLGQSTTAAIPFINWQEPPRVVFSKTELATEYTNTLYK
jgi:predicted GIY-YIG superfamily endonuclease